MSLHMRAVQEVWFADSGLFLDHSDVLAVLAHLATAAGSDCSEEEYGDKTSFWIQNGSAFLDYVESNKKFNVASVAKEMADEGTDLDPENLASFLDNLRSLAPEWREALDPRDKSLRFYVD